MTAKERADLLQTLQSRFNGHMLRHQGIAWAEVLARLESQPSAMRTLHEMECTGGEPDVIGHDPTTGAYVFCDCSAETPTGRRSLCFDEDALEKRKENKPAGSAVGVAAAIGIELLDEAQYRDLQRLGDYAARGFRGALLV